MLDQPHPSISQSDHQSSGDKRQTEELTLAAGGGSGSFPVSDLPEVRDFSPRQNQAWRWLLISTMGCVAASGVAIGAFVWLINLPPTADCENPTSITTDRAQLYCAQVAAEVGELDDVLAGLKLVGNWDNGHPLHYEVQPLVEQWSWVAYQEAQQKLLESDLDGAMALIEYIPASSPVYQTAQASLQDWNNEWEKGDAIWQEAQAALQKQDWGTVSRQVLALSELRNRHWRVNQVQALSQQIRQEQHARRQLRQAVEVASQGGPAQLGAALRTASQIDDATYAYKDAQPFMDRWSDWLLNLGLDKWYASELEAAISLGQNASVNPQRAKAAQELIWLSQSRQLAQDSVGTWRTSPKELMGLYRAMVLANQIPKDSPYYPQAQSSVTTWRTHLADLGQLQLAQLPGRVQNLETLKLAINQAAKVPVGNPRRQQAQTLMAHWRLEVERIEDRPYLTQAHRLAKIDQIEKLQQAIEVAGQIPVDRALRQEAQNWIYVWKHRIEILEDRPVLAVARELADEGKLSQAIAEAAQVKAGRALYDEAQTAIATWRREIATIEQARQRALQRAAARRKAAAAPPPPIHSTPEPTADSYNTSPGFDSTIPLPVRPTAPAPIQPQPMRLPLPRRIETVPGDSPTNRVPPAPSDTVLPGTSITQPENSRESLDPVSPTASPDPSLTGPVTSPIPVEPAPVVEQEFSIPIPAAPAPQLPSVPQSQDNSSAPAPVPTSPEAASPGQPSVSAAPLPEQVVKLKTKADTTVLFTGALYSPG